MPQNGPTECPFCEFEPDVGKTDVKTAPEMQVHEVHSHVREEHPDRVDELATDVEPR